MFRLVQWILSGALAIGIGSALVEQTYEMAKWQKPQSMLISMTK